jgi:hypothetical protein
VKSDRIKSTERSRNGSSGPEITMARSIAGLVVTALSTSTPITSFTLALEVRQTAAVADQIIDMDPAAAGAEIRNHEIRSQQRIDALVELDRSVVPVEPAGENFGQRGGHWKYLPKYLQARSSSVEGAISNPARARPTGQPIGTRDTIAVSIIRHVYVRKRYHRQ